MSASSPRPVRIPRASTARTAPGPTLSSPDENPEGRPTTLPPVGNRPGLARARRLLLLFLVALFGAYAVVISAMASSSYSAVRTDVAVYALFTAVALGSAMAGFVMTVGRAPWAVYVGERDLVVRERFGAVRRYPIDDSLRITVVARNGPSFLSPMPTETARVGSAHLKTREYILGPEVLEGIPEVGSARR